VLEFTDDTQVRLNGLDEILAEVFFEGRKANEDTVEEIIKRLEDKKNYIPSSSKARKDYSYALLKEYRKYIKDQN